MSTDWLLMQELVPITVIRLSISRFDEKVLQFCSLICQAASARRQRSKWRRQWVAEGPCLPPPGFLYM